MTSLPVCAALRCAILSTVVGRAMPAGLLRRVVKVLAIWIELRDLDQFCAPPSSTRAMRVVVG